VRVPDLTTFVERMPHKLPGLCAADAEATTYLFAQIGNNNPETFFPFDYQYNEGK
jgi:hypothetical protein